MPSSLNAPPEPGGLKAAASAWDRFFFSPADPTALGAIRIASGLLLLWSVGCLGLDLRGFLGSYGWADPSALRALRSGSGNLEWSLWNLVPDSLLWPAWSVAMIVLALFALGVGSRVTAPLAWAVAVSTARRNPFILFGFDQIVALWVFYLGVTGASGQALSIDRLIGRRRGASGPPRPTVSANLGLRLIQVHLCVIYGAAGLAKLRGISWWDGSAILKLLGNGEFRPFDLMWVLSGPKSLYLLNLATHLALWTEILYPVLIWKKSLRPWVLGAAVAMHAGIAITLGLTEFSLSMLAGNLAFVSGARLRSLLRRRHGLREESGVESSHEEIPAASSSPRPAVPPGRSRR